MYYFSDIKEHKYLIGSPRRFSRVPSFMKKTNEEVVIILTTKMIPFGTRPSKQARRRLTTSSPEHLQPK